MIAALIAVNERNDMAARPEVQHRSRGAERSVQAE